jgi:hypothetical protein
MFSAVSGIVSTPTRALNAGFMNRHPIVVSSIFAVREYALSAFPIT